MASNLAGATWKIDAADTVTPRTILGTQQSSAWDTGGPKRTITQCMALGMVQWNVGADGVAGDQVIMTDLAGNEVYRSAPCTGADFSDQTKWPDTVLAVGLIVTSLPHGILTLSFR